MVTKKHLGDYFTKRDEEGREGLPTWSVTINNGLVARDTLERKMDTNLSASDHLLIRKGDIAYNMMRMWQGASGLAYQDGLVSPAYVVLVPKDNMDPLFAAYWFKSPRMIYLFWAYSYGITKDRLRLYYKDFARIPVMPPPLEMQKKIAAFLLSWDKAIEKTLQLVDVKQKLKRGLMQQLLTGKRRFPEFGDEPWKELRISDLSTIHYGKSPKDIVIENGKYPVWGTGGVVGSTDSILYEYESVIIGRKGTIDCPVLTKGPFWAIDTTFFLEVSQEVIVEWLYYALAAIRWRRYNESSGVPSLSRDTVYSIHLLVPGREEQKKIAAVLNTIDQEIDILEEQREALQKQKRGLMQQLLTGKVRVKTTGGPS